VLQETVQFPLVSKPSRSTLGPLPLHVDLTHMPGGDLGTEEVVVASVDENLECPLCYVEVDPKKNAASHGGTHPQERGRSRLRASFSPLCIQD